MTCKQCAIDLTQKEPTCFNYGYPNTGNEQEKKNYVLHQIMSRDAYKDTVNAYKKSRIVLLTNAVLSVGYGFILYMSVDPMDIKINYLIGGVMFFGLWLQSAKSPFNAILFGIVLILVQLVFKAINNPIDLLNGLLLQIVMIIGLVYSLYMNIKFRKLQKTYLHLLD